MCVLLQRTTRKITPTEAGLLYYQQCLPILNELKEADASVSNINSTLQGKNNNVCTNGFLALASLPLTLGNLWKITLI
ncbi:transcriptional regulator [Mannheimia haemolytica]|uniref:Transcriptional regulator n=1 Tax=Mannheimia haemolytica TaxID=75985 RepID=A0A378N641_MANHA|nr:transcriptional regulator [Mannheimia haemolytica]